MILNKISTEQALACSVAFLLEIKETLLSFDLLILIGEVDFARRCDYVNIFLKLKLGGSVILFHFHPPYAAE